MIETPRVDVYTSDSSQVYSTVSSDINIAMPINSQTGPYRAKLNSPQELIDKYLTDTSVSAESDTTIKHAAKILQFSPIYVSRTTANKVLAGLTDRGDTIYTDLKFKLFNYKYDIELEAKPLTYDVVYFVLQDSSNKKYIIYSGDESKLPNISGAIKSNNYQFYATYDAGTNYYINDYAFIDGNYYKVFYTGSNSYISDISPNSDEGDRYWKNVTSEVLRPENLLSRINDIINEDEDGGELVFKDLSPFLSINITNEYSYLISSSNTRILKSELDPSINKFSESNVKSSYRRLDFYEDKLNNELSLTNNGYYCSFNGSTFYNPGSTDSSWNWVYPGSLVPIEFKTPSNSVSLAQFIIFMYDLQKFYPTLYLAPEINQSQFLLQLPTSTGSNFTLANMKIIGNDNISYHTALDTENNIIRNTPFNGTLSNVGIELVYTVGVTTKYIDFIVGSASNFKDDSGNPLIESATRKIIECKVSNGVNSSRYICTLQALLYYIYESMSETEIITFLNSNSTDFGLPKFECSEDSLSLFYNKLDLLTFESNLSGEFMSPTITTEDFNMYKYTISNYNINASTRTFNNVYVEVIEKNAEEEIISDLVFYNGKFNATNAMQELIQLSSEALTEVQFIKAFRKAIDNKYTCILTSDGASIMSTAEKNLTISTGNYGSSEEPDFNVYTDNFDFTSPISLSTFAIIPRYSSKAAIFRFDCVRDSNDPELYKLTIFKKSNESNYTISFAPNKVDGYGRHVYCNWINEVDEDVYLKYIGNNAPLEVVNSAYFGNGIPVLDPDSDDYVTALERFRRKDGVYYDFLFNGGYENVSVNTYMSALGRSIYAHALMSAPVDADEVSEIMKWRSDLGIDHYNSKMLVPYANDTTIGDFVSEISPCVYYMERCVINRSLGKEFAPVFGYTNGTLSMTPMNNYNDKDTETDPLLNRQICPVIYNSVKGVSYPALDLTLQTIDSSLSDSNNVRMINVGAHIMDDFMEKFIGDYNDEATREQVISGVTMNFNLRFASSSKFKPYKIIIKCDEENNPLSIIEQRLLVADLYYQFLPGIRAVKVYQKIVKLSADLSSLER